MEIDFAFGIQQDKTDGTYVLYEHGKEVERYHSDVQALNAVIGHARTRLAVWQERALAPTKIEAA